MVGGHQRYKILVNEQGRTEIEVSVVDMDPEQEKLPNIVLNKVEGGLEQRDEPPRDLVGITIPTRECRPGMDSFDHMRKQGCRRQSTAMGVKTGCELQTSGHLFLGSRCDPGEIPPKAAGPVNGLEHQDMGAAIGRWRKCQSRGCSEGASPYLGVAGNRRRDPDEHGAAGGRKE
ncbi:hypothetical protein [Paenibacillus tyrfis]|uniref:hypothetical protein n=1 Tax=Paenibacillus tyrfis TaxID=1501230 RepID=UPI00286B86B6|nr:hypothetical protein [Paenibacillus tyrfis]